MIDFAKLPARMQRKIAFEPMTGCWLWTGSITSDGYSQVWDGIRPRRAHRVVYEMLAGPIPDGLHIDHLCRVRSCVNPDHLEPVTMRENLARGLPAKKKWKAHCKRGHELAGENLRIDRLGRRVCRACHNMHAAAAVHRGGDEYRVWHAGYERERRARIKALRASVSA